MAEMMDNLDPAVWQSVEASTMSGLKEYTLIRRQKVNPKQYRYAIRCISDEDTEDMPNVVLLEGANAKKDPMGSVANCELVLKDGQVVVVNVDGDCVAKKSFL